jgi:hypothetical protein
MKRVFALLAAIAMSLVIVPAASAEADPVADLTNIRTGRHATFDRVVLDLTGPQPGGTSSVVPEVISCGSGKPISVPGNEFAEVHLQPARGWNYTGPRNFATPGLANVRGVAISCDFEADLGVDVGYEKPGSQHSVFFLQNPLRLVIDVQH